jgi:AhpD family alkylhydroperoxidase
MDLARLAGAPVDAMVKLEERIDLDPGLRELVRLRASLINGCAFCIDMHWTALRSDGESEVRLAQLAAWEESPFFDERERAALALTDAVTRVSATASRLAIVHSSEGRCPNLGGRTAIATIPPAAVGPCNRRTTERPLCRM